MRVLSIDGGGIRGILPATLLVALESITGKRIYELFDLIVGTSTGGILAIALTCPLADGKPARAEEVRSLYLEHGESIFPLGDVPFVGVPSSGSALLGYRPPLASDATALERFQQLMGYGNIAKVTSVIGGTGAQGNARYPATGLESQLSARFGERRMSEALIPIGVVSCDFDRGEPIMFWGGGITSRPSGDAKMKDAARATSAAPTFFAPLLYTDLDARVVCCVDGGLIANDPAFVGYTAAMRLLRSQGRAGEEVILVSLGTGLAGSGDSLERHDAAQLGDTRSWAQLAPALMIAFTTGPGALIREQLAFALGDSYHRIQTVLPTGVSAAMDDARPEHVHQLLNVSEATVEGIRGRLADIARRLSPT